MILIKLLSSDGILFEEELQSCKQFRNIWQAYQDRNRVPNAPDEPYPVNVLSDELKHLLDWGRLTKRLPYEERTKTTVTDEHITIGMTPEKCQYLSIYTTGELHTLVRGCCRLNCWRLHREINWRLDLLDKTMISE